MKSMERVGTIYLLTLMFVSISQGAVVNVDWCFSCSPLTTNINVGDTVIWTITGSFHNVRSTPTGPLNSPNLSPGGKYSFTFTTTGSFSYQCTIHPFMTGKVNVGGIPATSCEGDGSYPHTIEGDTATVYTCPAGQYGSKSKTCSAGTWSSEINNCVNCPSGFTSPGNVPLELNCTDINECSQSNGGCSPFAECINIPGSRSCQCGDGYFGDGITCEESPCQPDSGFPATQSGGVVTLINCPAGQYGKTSRICYRGEWSQIDNKCMVCPAGYTSPANSLNSTSCKDINECVINNGGCSPTYRCLNTPGSRVCKCLPGYTVNQTTLLCVPDAATLAMKPLSPVCRILFQDNRAFKTSPTNCSVDIGSNAKTTMVYRRNAPGNQALVMNGKNVLRLSSTYDNSFSIFIHFYPDSFNTSDLLTMKYGSYSPIFTLSLNSVGRLTVKRFSTILGNLDNLFPLRRSHFAFFSFQNRVLTIYVNERKIVTYNFNLPTPSNPLTSFEVGKLCNGMKIHEFTVTSIAPVDSNFKTFTSPLRCVNACTLPAKCFNGLTTFACA